MRYVAVERWNGGVRFRGDIEAPHLLAAIFIAKREYGQECLAVPPKVARKLEPGAAMNELRQMHASER